MFSMLPIGYSASFLYVCCVFFCVSREFQNPCYRAFLHSRWAIFHLPYPYVPFRFPLVPSCVPLRFAILNLCASSIRRAFPCVSRMFLHVVPVRFGTLTFYHVFPMDSLSFPSSSHFFFWFPVSFRPAFPVHNTIWNPCVSPYLRYLSFTFTMFPVAFPLVSFLCLTSVSPGFLGVILILPYVLCSLNND